MILRSVFARETFQGGVRSWSATRAVTAWVGASVAVVLGLVVAWATRSDFAGLTLAGVVFIAAAASILSLQPTNALLVLIPWVVVQNVFVFEIGFFFLPAYVLSAILFMRLAATGWLKLKGRPLGLLMMLYLLGLSSIPVAMHIDAHLSINVGDPRYSTMRPFVQFGALLLVSSIFFVASSIPITARQVTSCVRAFAWLGIAVSMYALYQQASYYLGLSTLEDILPPRRLAEAVSYSPQGFPIFRSNALFLEPNGLGNFLLASLSLSLAAALGHRRLFGFAPPLGWFGILLQAGGLVSTFSVGAFAGVLISVMILVLFGGKKSRLTMLVGTAAIGIVSAVAFFSASLQRNESVAAILVGRVEERIEVETAPESATNPQVGGRRVDYWAAAVEILIKYPLTGVGIGNFGEVAATLDPRLNYNAGSYGLVWAWIGEFGLPGLVLYLVFIAGFLRFFWARYRAERALLLLGFTSGFAGMMAQYFGSGYTRLEIHIWLFLGLGVAAARATRLSRSHKADNRAVDLKSRNQRSHAIRMAE